MHQPRIHHRNFVDDQQLAFQLLRIKFFGFLFLARQTQQAMDRAAGQTCRLLHPFCGTAGRSGKQNREKSVFVILRVFRQIVQFGEHAHDPFENGRFTSTGSTCQDEER
ncbi:hypothetical protein SDC9_148618 [bioreactor metagenome]|uniref:Uncharacterized protein n=1 Tax=bioreactor metagenome TaxID=1076179 RepID=A0A645EJU9_9ZZZZ